MSILKVANVHFDASGTNRIAYGSNDNIIRVSSGAVKLPVGDTASRPTAEAGLIRYNSQTGAFEGYNASAWGAITVVDLSDPFDQANTARVHANAAFGQANTARVHANAAFGQANTARDTGNTAQTTAVSAFGKANSALANASTTLAGSLGITGALGVGTAASATAGEIRATNNITAYYSDKRLKTNIKKIENALAKLSKITGVTFQASEEAAKYGYTDTKTQVGILAQEVEAVLPEVVVPAPFDIAQNPDGTEYSKSGQNYKTVQYEKLIPLLIEAIKDLKAEIDMLKGN